MAAELQQFFFNGEIDRASSGEFNTFLSCNDKIGKILRWTHQADGSSTQELRQLALSQGGLFNGKHNACWLCVMRTYCIRGNGDRVIMNFYGLCYIYVY